MVIGQTRPGQAERSGPGRARIFKQVRFEDCSADKFEYSDKKLEIATLIKVVFI